MNRERHTAVEPTDPDVNFVKATVVDTGQGNSAGVSSNSQSVYELLVFGRPNGRPTGQLWVGTGAQIDDELTQIRYGQTDPEYGAQRSERNNQNKTAELSQRRQRDAPNIWVP